jgi:ferric-dicitrate binding protein FerR (iron transport regulator)
MVRSWRAPADGEPVAERIVSVPRAQQAQFRLPDGTTVILGGGSSLHHPHVFGATRRVSLQGEAYFEVAHDARRPFQVLAGDLIATDLGTEFLVRAYPEDARARVVVRSGEVGLRPAASRDSTTGAVVRPGQVGRRNPHGMLTIERADTAAYFAWTRGILVFDATPLREALPQLSRWYDLDFRLADSSLGSIPLTGRLDRTLTDDRLELLASSLGLVQTRAGRVVTLSPASRVNR